MGEWERLVELVEAEVAVAGVQAGRVPVGWKPMYRPFRHPVNLQLARQKIKNRQPLFRVTFTRPSLDRQPVYGLTVGLRSVEVPGGRARPWKWKSSAVLGNWGRLLELPRLCE